jgi:hypothetical protein
MILIIRKMRKVLKWRMILMGKLNNLKISRIKNNKIQINKIWMKDLEVLESNNKTK